MVPTETRGLARIYESHFTTEDDLTLLAKALRAGKKVVIKVKYDRQRPMGFATVKVTENAGRQRLTYNLYYPITKNNQSLSVGTEIAFIK